MSISPKVAKLSCAYFFAVPALVYGLLTSRMPAIKEQLGASDSQIGLVLLALGCATFAGLLVCAPILEKLGTRRVIAASAVGIILFMVLGSLAFSLEYMIVFCLLAGFCVGLCDVALNAQGIFLEQQHDIPCLSFLHGISSLGAVTGSITGSVFAGYGIAPFGNLALPLGIFLLFFPLGLKGLVDCRGGGQKHTGSWAHIPAIVWVCAILGLICHIAEGATGEWGSIFLQNVKGSSHQQAALAFGACTAMMVISRFLGDRLRQYLGVVWLICGGSLIAAFGMFLVLLSLQPGMALFGYAILGAGIGPVVPMLFSVAGSAPATSPAMASAVVSVLSYAGMLVIPPLLGMLSGKEGIATTLWIIPFCCLVTALGAFFPGFGNGKNAQ